MALYHLNGKLLWTGKAENMDAKTTFQLPKGLEAETLGIRFLP